MEISEALATAKDSIVQAELPNEWQSEAFNLVLSHLLGSSIGPAVAGANAGGPVGGQAQSRTTDVGDNPTARLAARVGVPAVSLLDVFEFTEDSVTLHVASARIATAKARATQEVALLVAVSRQGSGLDDGWTSTSHIREALQNYNRYDQGNFASNLKALKDAFNSRGKGSGMELRLTQPGWETATQLLQKITGVTA